MDMSILELLSIPDRDAEMGRVWVEMKRMAENGFLARCRVNISLGDARHHTEDRLPRIVTRLPKLFLTEREKRPGHWGGL